MTLATGTCPAIMQCCHAIVRSLEPGFSGLLSGFAALSSMREIKYHESFAPPPLPRTDLPWHLQSLDLASMTIIIGDGLRCVVDVHDSWEIDESSYSTAHVYFKRSYDPARFPPQSFARLKPLGLIHDVRSNGIDTREAHRIASVALPLGDKCAELARFTLHTLQSLIDLGPRPNLSAITATPDNSLEPRVLFMAGLWDPGLVPADREDKRGEFEAVNEMRVACVRRLRREFGPRFCGGILHSKFASSRYPDALIDDPRTASKRAYLARVRQFPICVGTTGLHGSNGWKLAEYVALSRAIVSEPLRYAVPGDFNAPNNYLEFRTPDQCAEQVQRLFDDPALRERQMHENHAYYRHYMRPDALARYVLDTAASA